MSNIPFAEPVKIMKYHLQYRDLVEILWLQQLLEYVRPHDEGVNVRRHDEVVLRDQTKRGFGDEHPLQLRPQTAGHVPGRGWLQGVILSGPIAGIFTQPLLETTLEFALQIQTMVSCGIRTYPVSIAVTTWLPSLMSSLT